jgi:hypothetical protein
VSDVRGGNGSSPSAPIQINQDANIFVTELEAGQMVHLKLRAGRSVRITATLRSPHTIQLLFEMIFDVTRCGVWCVVCGVWCVVCGVWCVVQTGVYADDGRAG